MEGENRRKNLVVYPGDDCSLSYFVQLARGDEADDRQASGPRDECRSVTG